jgi:late competence protein required for DNA uptake (superfamily II DNA/RNA helicase)
MSMQIDKVKYFRCSKCHRHIYWYVRIGSSKYCEVCFKEQLKDNQRLTSFFLFPNIYDIRKWLTGTLNGKRLLYYIIL